MGKYWNTYRNNVNGRLRGRIICIDVKNKILRLSLLPHVLNLTLPSNYYHQELDVGCIVDDLKIVRIDRGFGMLAVYPLSSQQQQTLLQQTLHHDNTSNNNNYDDDYSTAYYDLDDLEYGNAFNNNSDDDDDNNTKKKKRM